VCGGAREVSNQSGNVGARHRDENFRTIIKVAVEHAKPVRIGVNWGSLDQDLLTGDDGRERRQARAGRREGRLHGGHDRECAAIGLACRGNGAPHDQIVISAKISQVQDLLDCYRRSRAVATIRSTSDSPKRGSA